MIIKCPECKRDVSDSAESCPHCGYTLNEDDKSVGRFRAEIATHDAQERKKRENRYAWIKWSVAILMLFILWRACVSSAEGYEEEAKLCNEANARLMAQSFVERQIKNPSSAEYGAASHWKYRRPADGSWVVESWVDATNSFGATVRTRFEIQMNCNGDGNWTLIDSKFGD